MDAPVTGSVFAEQAWVIDPHVNIKLRQLCLWEKGDLVSTATSVEGSWGKTVPLAVTVFCPCDVPFVINNSILLSDSFRASSFLYFHQMPDYPNAYS